MKATDNDGVHCPACSEDIGLWPIFSAGLPTRIKCPHCGVALTYRDTGVFLVVLLLALAAVAAGAYVTATAMGGAASWRWPFVGLLLAGWIPIELGATILLRTRKMLALR